MDFPSRAEEIVVSSALLFEESLHCHGQLGHNCFLRTALRKRKSLFLVINMAFAFADLMLEAVSVPLFVYFKRRFSAMEYHMKGWGVGLLLPSRSISFSYRLR